MVKRIKPMHHFDRREMLIAVIVFVGVLSMYSFYQPTAQVVAKNSACTGGTANGFCDHAYRARCESTTCNDCSVCLPHCTNVCAAQGQFVEYCRSNYYCSCTNENPCVK